MPMTVQDRRMCLCLCLCGAATSTTCRDLRTESVCREDNTDTEQEETQVPDATTHVVELRVAFHQVRRCQRDKANEDGKGRVPLQPPIEGRPRRKFLHSAHERTLNAERTLVPLSVRSSARCAGEGRPMCAALGP
jgi:hypothetical protein